MFPNRGTLKRSEILLFILIVMFIALVIASFVIPQEVKDNNEMLFLGIVLPIMGWLWLQAYIDATKGKG